MQHHVRNDGGAWTYENWFSLREECAWIMLFETDFPMRISDCWIKWTRDCAEADDYVFYRLREVGNGILAEPLDGNFAIYPCGCDAEEQEMAEDGSLQGECLEATLERETK